MLIGCTGQVEGGGHPDGAWRRSRQIFRRAATTQQWALRMGWPMFTAARTARATPGAPRSGSRLRDNGTSGVGMQTCVWDNSYKMLHSLKRRIWPQTSAMQYGSTGFRADGFSLDQLRDELEQLTIQVLQRAGVTPACVSVSIETVAAAAADRVPVLRAMITLVQWDTKSAMRMFLGLAHIERALHRSVAASWLSHAAHFDGVWLHPSREILQGPGMKQLASVLSSLERGTQAPGESVWSGESAFEPSAQSTLQG